MKATFVQRLREPPLSLEEQGVFAERLALLLGASLSLPEAVGLLEDSFGARRAGLLRDLRRALESGTSFEVALTRSRLGFRRIMVLSARIGERSGTLAEVLAAAESQIGRRRAAQKGVLSACAYPALVCAAAFGIIGFLVFFIMPKIMPTLLSLHIPLPLLTRAFMAVSQGIASDWWKWGIAVAIVAAALSAAYRLSPWAKRAMHLAILRAPPVSGIVRDAVLAGLLDTLSVLTAAGCSLDESLSDAAFSLALVPYRDAVSSSIEAVRNGGALAEAWGRHPSLFPGLVVQGIAVGERTGSLAAILGKLAEYHARELESALSGVARMIEPALMIVLGGVVAGAALSIVMPIYDISQHISG